jgi:hypothetical protein
VKAEQSALIGKHEPDQNALQCISWLHPHKYLLFKIYLPFLVLFGVILGHDLSGAPLAAAWWCVENVRLPACSSELFAFHCLPWFALFQFCGFVSF